jgi:hypothetical protein
MAIEKKMEDIRMHPPIHDATQASGARAAYRLAGIHTCWAWHTLNAVQERAAQQRLDVINPAGHLPYEGLHCPDPAERPTLLSHLAVLQPEQHKPPSVCVTARVQDLQEKKGNTRSGL